MSDQNDKDVWLMNFLQNLGIDNNRLPLQREARDKTKGPLQREKRFYRGCFRKTRTTPPFV